MPRRRVLLVQPSLQPPGGGNGVAAWMLQALVRDHAVTVLSWQPVAVEPINRFFGTSLSSADFVGHVVPRRWRLLPDALPVPAALLRSSLLMRYTRRISAGFDLVIGAHNETDFGRRGLQYVHYPTYLRPRPDVDMRWYHYAPLLEGYYRVADRLAGFSVERMKANLTLANSDWTAARLRRSLGIRAITVYPPVVASAPLLPWAERRSHFLAVGRLAPEKEYERIIRILAKARAQVSDLTLTIVGTWDRHTQAYYQSLQVLAAAVDRSSDWLTFRRDLTREQLQALIGASRYGIHGMREEHFGMAPAEMVRGGMIVWVPNGGGQTEIVGDEPALRYDDEDEATMRIVAVLNSAGEQARLRAHLETRAKLFDIERFEQEIRKLVEQL